MEDIENTFGIHTKEKFQDMISVNVYFDNLEIETVIQHEIFT